MNSVYLSLFIVKDEKYIECIFDCDTSFEVNIERIFEMTETAIWDYRIYDPLKMLFIQNDKTPADYSLISCRCLFVL